MNSRLKLGTTFIGIALFGSACTSSPLGATDAEVAHARSRSANGALVYERYCASCHGDRGAGLGGVPPVMGEGALPTYQKDAAPTRQYVHEERLPPEADRAVLSDATRSAFRSAHDVYGYLSTHMPKIRPKDEPPTTEEYWELTSFLLVVNGTDVPPSGVDASNADKVLVKP